MVFQRNTTSTVASPSLPSTPPPSSSYQSISSLRPRRTCGTGCMHCATSRHTGPRCRLAVNLTWALLAGIVCFSGSASKSSRPWHLVALYPGSSPTEKRGEEPGYEARHLEHLGSNLNYTSLFPRLPPSFPLLALWKKLTVD